MRKQETNQSVASRRLSLKTAVSHIKQACEGARSPFFFLVGAGISCPQVPLAQDIEDDCKKAAQELGREEEPDAGLAALRQAQPIFCDHPGTVERIDPERDDLQIVHVHGTYQFYDCCNLPVEMEDRAHAPGMAEFLDRRRLARPLPVNLYWFCYSTAAIETLPAWLKMHPSVL